MQSKHITDDNRLTRLEVVIESINETLKRLDSRMDRIESKLDKLEDRLWTHFYWTITGFTGTWVMLAKVLHWF